MKIAIAGFMHESNTFAETPTELRHFREGSLRTGADIVAHWKDAHHEVGGFLEGASRCGFEAIPVLMASATPSGPVTAAAYEAILADVLSGLDRARPFDGLLLALHGAMVCDAFLDADGETASRIRAHLGQDLPIVLTLDLHANVSKRLVDSVTATITYRTYPHVRQRFRGLEAADLIARTVRGQARPVQALRKPPLLPHIVTQYTGSGPGREIMGEVEAVAAQPGILSASYAPGFPYADVPNVGPAVIVVADGDRSLADRHADRLRNAVWSRREALTARLPTPEEAVREAAATPGPVTLLDCGDNVGGGSPGDSTILLAEILRQDVRDALVIFYDPAAVDACVSAGVRESVSLSVGGKTDTRHGAPVAIAGTVRTLADGRYVEPEPRHGGKRFGDMGRTAVVATDEGHAIVLTSLREAPMSLQQILSLGIRPESRKILIAKGAVAPRAAYEPVSTKVIAVDTPGVTAANVMNFPYRHRPRPLYPLERG